jgi:hypothetical protein
MMVVFANLGPIKFCSQYVRPGFLLVFEYTHVEYRAHSERNRLTVI